MNVKEEINKIAAYRDEPREATLTYLLELGLEQYRKRNRKKPIFISSGFPEEFKEAVRKEAERKGISQSQQVEIYLRRFEYDPDYPLQKGDSYAGWNIAPHTYEHLKEIKRQWGVPLSKILHQAVQKGVKR